MAYIGNIPAEAYISISSQTFTTINGTGYTLSSSVESSEDIALFLNNVRQKPSTYTATGTSLTMGTATTTADELYCVYLGKALQTVNPGADSVGTSQIADDAVTTAKIADLNVTVGKLPASVDLSTKTVTLPASVSGLGTGITNAQLAGSIDVTSKITGVVPTANLGSGTASSSTYLAGDQTYKEVVAIDIAWQSVVTAATLTAVAGRGYPIDTSSNACTVTLPGSASVGDQIIFTDYARNWNTNAVTINQNSLNYQGNSSPNPEYDTAGETVHIVYMDATKGWIPINDGAVAMETAQTYNSEYLIVAGGGAGGEATTSGGYGRGGGGAGGYLTNFGGSALVLTPSTVYTVTVGAGGAIQTDQSGGDGGDSILSGSDITDVTATGGGGGGGQDSYEAGRDGGSAGGGGFNSASGGTATPSPAQGNDGGTATAGSGAGGGGAGAVGGNSAGTDGGDGGNGTANSITGASVTYAGGGGGGGNVKGDGGTGGGGDGFNDSGGQIAATAGTDNLGGGGGGAAYSSATGGKEVAGAGGKGVVILRVLTADYSGTTTGSPTVTTDGSHTVIKFTDSGSYTG